ncbi:MAG: VWA domain-containing protein, partial [Chloroflexi bacterium]|nr:VWA domain-containing protein [Chloroflexota bacterium]
MKAHRPRWPALGLALAMLAGALCSLALARPAEARPLDQAPAPSACAVDLQASARPPVLLAGETLQLELELRATCLGPSHSKSVVLVLDASGSWLGQPIQAQKDAARELVRRLDLPGNPSTRVGVAMFNSSARTLCQLTNEVGRVLACVGKFGAGGGTAIDRGIIEGLRVLRYGRSVPSGERITEILVVLTDGQNNAGCDSVERAALQAKNQDVLMITVCVGPDCDAACMRAAASSDRDFLAIPDLAGLVGASDRIADRILGLSLRETSLRLEL